MGVAAQPGEEPLRLPVDGDGEVSGLLLGMRDARAGLVLGHGAGTRLDHPSMRATAQGLAGQRIATLRYNFPYSERGSRRPDAPALCHATVRAAVAAARSRGPQLSWFAGGRSFGGRMTSQAQAEHGLEGIRGLVFFGFPLHPAGEPGIKRAEHLDRVDLPMLFVQGTQDALAERERLEGVIGRLGARAEVEWVMEADHSFHVPVRSGRRDPEVLEALLACAAGWMLRHA
ncbi:MAG: dienelactone hydrolase family protein [Proteobacteria bacterium]|nr:dienelactone hydrolase family protein [Pseudomonadota bacterium]